MALSKKIILTVTGHTIRLSTPLNLFQNDQIYLLFEINEYGIEVKNGTSESKTIMPINPLEATLYIETPFGVDSVESASIENNMVVFHLEKTYTQYVGTSKMQIQLTDEGCCQITLPYFEFSVKSNIYDPVNVVRTVLLEDGEETLIVDENGNVINSGTETYTVATVSEENIQGFATKQIQDYSLDTAISGEEDILIQDEGVTKRVKINDILQSSTAEDVVFSANMKTPLSLGGIDKGTDLNNLTVQEVLTKLLFPYVAPTLSASLSYTPSGNAFEYGNFVTINSITGKVSKKSESIVKVGFLDSTTVLQEITDDVDSDGTYKYVFPTPITVTTNLSSSRFKFSVTDTVKTYYANTSGINFYYPYYFGVIDENQEITSETFWNLTKRVEGKGNKTNYYTTNNQHMLIAYPKSYGNLKKILDANSFDVTGTFTKKEVDIIGLDGTAQIYYVYINNASTVSNFKMTFQY